MIHKKNRCGFDIFHLNLCKKDYQVNGVKIMHSIIRGKCKKVLHKHIGSNMEALFKVVYHSLRLFFY